MVGYNCIMVYSPDKRRILMCRRVKDPYKGLYNLVGGHIEAGELGEAAAYRELSEETGITDADITLKHLMDFTYYNQGCYVEVWCGRLKHEVAVVDEANPLVWLELDRDFFSMEHFAGEGNIGHMLEQVKQFGEGYLD
ncbi:MAG: NUDIX hydrolase [Clostridia bacterium]|nr:NUDIX hydrolase [Clostridia bacterium]